MKMYKNTEEIIEEIMDMYYDLKDDGENGEELAFNNKKICLPMVCTAVLAGTIERGLAEIAKAIKETKENKNGK